MNGNKKSLPILGGWFSMLAQDFLLGSTQLIPN